MYVSTSQGELVALKRRTGVEVWRDDSLKLRSLSAPAVVGDYVAVADLEGYVHWFDRATGTVAGARQDRRRSRHQRAVVRQGNLYVISDKGDIVALHGLPLPRARREGAKPASRLRRRAPAAPPGG